jgi:hypothetical protein
MWIVLATLCWESFRSASPSILYGHRMQRKSRELVAATTACTSSFLLFAFNSWSSRITCTHHLWTIPLLLAASRTGTLHILCYPLSFICMTINVLLSRWMTPSHIEYSFSDTKYLNVNLSHALWKDIKFDILQINYDNPPAGLYLFRLLWRWQGFNTLVFGVLCAICWGVSGGEARVC